MAVHGMVEKRQPRQPFKLVPVWACGFKSRPCLTLEHARSTTLQRTHARPVGGTGQLTTPHGGDCRFSPGTGHRHDTEATQQHQQHQERWQSTADRARLEGGWPLHAARGFESHPLRRPQSQPQQHTTHTTLGV